MLTEIGAAGYGAFSAADKSSPGPLTETSFSDAFYFHDGFGYIIFLGSLVLFFLAVGAELGRNRVLLALGVPVLTAIQILLAWAGEGQAIVGIFHPLNAVLIAAYVGSLAARAWRTARK